MKQRTYSYDFKTNMVTCHACRGKFARNGMASYDAHIRICDIDVHPLADDYDGMDAPACGHAHVGSEELVKWFVAKASTSNHQTTVERLLKDYDVVRKTT